MGEKGTRQSAAGSQACAQLLADLAPLGEVSTRKMFGGFGVFADGVMFAIVDTFGDCFLRADRTTEDEFSAAGSGRHGRMPYWQIPAPVRRDRAALLAWARNALDVARRAAHR